MLSLWNWFITHVGIIGLIVSIVVCVTGILKIYTDIHGQRQTKRIADEKNKLELKAYRKQFCVPLLSSIHELAPIVAELRKAHDDLWARQKYFFQAGSKLKRINRVFETAYERAARAGSELSIDPAGQEAMDAFIAYLKAQDDYVQAIIKPMSKVHTRPFNKADISTLDELAKKANDKLTVLEEAIRTFVDSPSQGEHITRRNC